MLASSDRGGRFRSPSVGHVEEWCSFANQRPCDKGDESVIL
jgi:hypothetical protein